MTTAERAVDPEARLQHALDLSYRLALEQMPDKPSQSIAFGGVGDVKYELRQNLYDFTKQLAPEGFSEAYRQTYIRNEGW